MKSSWVDAHLQQPFDLQLSFGLPLPVAETDDYNDDDKTDDSGNRSSLYSGWIETIIIETIGVQRVPIRVPLGTVSIVVTTFAYAVLHAAVLVVTHLLLGIKYKSGL